MIFIIIIGIITLIVGILATVIDDIQYKNVTILIFTMFTIILLYASFVISRSHQNCLNAEPKQYELIEEPIYRRI